MINFRLNLVKKNDITLPQAYGNFTRPKFYSIFASLVLASVITKTFVYWISSKSIHFCYFGPSYWIRCFEFLSHELIYNQ